MNPSHPIMGLVEISVPESSLQAAIQIIEVARSKGITLKLIGGLAFKVLCQSARREELCRESKDIDLIGRREDTAKIMHVLEGLGYEPRRIFNTLNMGKRLIYYYQRYQRKVDVFLDEFEMCHKFNFKNSLYGDSLTLPITELVITKLQIVEMNEKDCKDLIASFLDFDLGDGKDNINLNLIAELCSRDWGICKTFQDSLKKVIEIAPTVIPNDYQIVTNKAMKIIEAIEHRPKTLKWRIRAKIGERLRWYELPEEDRVTISSLS